MAEEKKPEPTVDLGCGESVKGGRCLSTDNVENCLFDNF